jgi:hypothetical protein
MTIKLQKTVGKTMTNSKFIFADLAGSERIEKSGVINMVNMRAEEAKNINGSLSALGRVIQTLTQKSSFVTWRDSTLTMLLKDSLSGNMRTALVVTVSGSPDMISES